MLSVRELKHRYKMLKAKGDVLPIGDLGMPLPLSTGSPFLDSMINENLRDTADMNEEEHLMRSWQLMQGATEAELKLVMKNLDGCLNDHKLLLALYLFSEGDARFEKVLDNLPMKWRFLFPAAAIKPASAFLTGWRMDLRFRLVDKPDFKGLKEYYHHVLERARDEQVMKFRAVLKEAMALLHWRPEGEKEKAIHDWCFGEGRASEELPLLKNYLNALEKAKAGDEKGFARELENHENRIPLTSLMGLMSMFGAHLSLANGERYRRYAVATASPIEAILRFNEWGQWLTSDDIDAINKKITASRAMTIPFHKVVNAYLASPLPLRPELFDKVYLPMMKKFSDQMAPFIPKGTEVVLMQPNNFVNIMSFLFLATVSYERSTRILLVGQKLDQIDNKTVLNFDALREVMMKDTPAVQEFLLKQFGGQVLNYEWVFDEKVAAKAFDTFGPNDMLIMDMPFVFSTRILERLLPMKRALNLGNNFGSPSEISLSVKYVPTLSVKTRKSRVDLYLRYSSTAVSSLAGFIERLEWFNRMGGAVKC